MKFLTDLISSVATHAFSLYNQINESGIGQAYIGLKNTVRGFLGRAISGLFGLFSGVFASKSNTASSDAQSEVEVVEPVVKNQAKQQPLEPNPNSMTYALNHFRKIEAQENAQRQEEKLRIEQLNRGKGIKVD